MFSQHYLLGMITLTSIMSFFFTKLANDIGIFTGVGVGIFGFIGSSLPIALTIVTRLIVPVFVVAFLAIFIMGMSDVDCHWRG